MIEPAGGYLARFRPGRSSTDQIFTPVNFWEFLRVYQRRPVYTCFVDLKKASGFLVKSFGKCFGRTVLMILVVKSLYSDSEIRVRVGGVKSTTTVHRGCWIPTRMCAVTIPLHSL